MPPDGDLVLRNGEAQPTVQASGGSGSVTCGGNGTNGDVVVKNASGISVVTLEGAAARAVVGSQGANGKIVLRDSQMIDVLILDASNGNITCGANGKDGDLVLRNAVAQPTIEASAGSGSLTCGGNGTNGDVIVKDSGGTERIRLDGATGDIRLTGADFAEDFDMRVTDVAPGTVMVIASDGHALEPCSRAYDRRAAGVISGAGAYRPGIVMDKQQGRAGRRPVALSGKVYCLADASHGAIRCGDLLTTSETPGHAMKAADLDRAFGSVIGKALGNLDEGRGLVPVLVALQ